MRFLVCIALALAACVAFVAKDSQACDGAAAYSAAVVGFAPCQQQLNFEYAPAPPPAAAFWAPEFYMAPAPQRAYVQRQEVLGYAPQQFAQVRTAYVKTAAVTGFAPAANVGYVTAPVALRGRFAGNPAVGALHGAAQLNTTGAIVGAGRERVLRPTLFKRKVGSVVAAPNAVVGAVVVPGGY